MTWVHRFRKTSGGLDTYQFEFVSDFIHETSTQWPSVCKRFCGWAVCKTNVVNPGGGNSSMYLTATLSCWLLICGSLADPAVRLKLYALLKAEGQNYLCSVSWGLKSWSACVVKWQKEMPKMEMCHMTNIGFQNDTHKKARNIWQIRKKEKWWKSIIHPCNPCNHCFESTQLTPAPRP